MANLFSLITVAAGAVPEHEHDCQSGQCHFCGCIVEHHGSDLKAVVRIGDVYISCDGGDTLVRWSDDGSDYVSMPELAVRMLVRDGKSAMWTAAWGLVQYGRI